MSDAEYAWDLALLVNTPAQAESLKHRQEQEPKVMVSTEN